MVELLDRSFDQLLEMAAITFRERGDLPIELKTEFIREFQTLCQRAGLDAKERQLFAMWVGNFALEVATLFGRLRKDKVEEKSEDLPPEGWEK